MNKVSFIKRLVEAARKKGSGDVHQINSRETTSVGDFSFGLDFVQPDGTCKHVELSGPKPDKVNS